MRIDCWLVVFLCVSLVFSGCEKREPASASVQRKARKGEFQTHFKDESQFIVESILTDVAEMAFYARNKTLPDPNAFSVNLTEKPDSKYREPVYDVQILLKKNKLSLKFRLEITGPIWSSELYTNAAKLIFQDLGLSHQQSVRGNDDAEMLKLLLDAKASTIEEENQSLSELLQKDFRNPILHEKAAALIGVFALRESSAFFWDARSQLCRISAHLIFASTLSSVPERSFSGKIAEICANTLMGNQRAALEEIDRLNTPGPTAAAWSRILSENCTADYRLFEKIDNPTPLEHIARFTAFSLSADVNSAWERLSRSDLQLPDYCRVANSVRHSVETGHDLLKLALPLERQEIDTIYELSHGGKLTEKNFASELNELPDRCFRSDSKGRVDVHVIGWGQWAAFFQRHLCHAIQQNYYFLKDCWGVPEEAKEFVADCEKDFSALRLYPLVRKFNARDKQAYHEAVDECLDLIEASPQFVTTGVWNELLYKPNFAALYSPQNNLIEKWQKHSPLPGVTYDFFYCSRSVRKLTLRPDFLQIVEKLHDQAPYCQPISEWLIYLRHHDKSTYEQRAEVFGPVLEFSVCTMLDCARAATNNPDRYEALMARVGELKPASYLEVGDYFVGRTNNEKAAFYYEKYYHLNPDKVQVSNNCRWLMWYYLNKGDKDRAKAIADFCGEVYSHRGLYNKAEFLEAVKEYDEAFEWYKRIEDRYNSSNDLIDYCFRYRALTGDDYFQKELDKRFKKIFPRGTEKVGLANFSNAPTSGTLINQDGDLLKQARLKKGDVIVALYGTNVQTLSQYLYIRDTGTSPKLELIVWDGTQYREVKASPPKKRFGVDFRDYKPQ